MIQTKRVEKTSKNYVDSIWKNKNFLLLWTGNGVSSLTMQVFKLGLPLIIYQMTTSVLAMSMMRAIEIIPTIIFGMLIGVLVDRTNRKKFMFLSITIQFLAICLIFILSLFDVLNLWVLYFLGFFLYTSSYAFSNVYHTILPLIVNKEQLTSANSNITLVSTIINIIGPSFAGLILAYFDYTYGLLFTVVGLLVLLFFSAITQIPNQIDNSYTIENNKKSTKGDSIWANMREGWAELSANRYLWIITILGLLVNLSFAATNGVLIFYALDYLSVTKAELGAIFSFAAIGGIVASLVSKKSKNYLKDKQLFLVSFGLASLGQFMIFLSTNWLFTSISMAIVGFSTTFYIVHYLTLRQETTPNHLLGRVAGTSAMLLKLVMPVGYLIAGILGEFVKIDYIFLGSSILTLMVFIYTLTTKSLKKAQ